MNFMRVFVVIIMIINFTRLNAQLMHDYNWAFGYGPGVPRDTYYFGGFILSFTEGKVHFINQARDYDMAQSHNYSSKDGNLECLSNGCLIAKGDSKIVKGGEKIKYGRARDNCPNYLQIFQDGLFINDNDDSLIYFIYGAYDSIGKIGYREALLMATIDINQDVVIKKDEILFSDTFQLSALSGIKSLNDSSWWIINPELLEASILVLELKNGKVTQTIKNRIGKATHAHADGATQGVFSPDGKKYAMYNPMVGLQLFDFDRKTGILSNFKFFNYIFDYAVAGSCCFSPNSRFLYFNTPIHVMQIDLENPDSLSALDTVGIYDNYLEPYPTTFLQMVHGPDCRIYITCYGGNRYLHVINFPNKKGKSCNLLNRGILLPGRNRFATPNNPHYRIDRAIQCDSTIEIDLNITVGDNPTKLFNSSAYLIYPQPSHGNLTIQIMKRNMVVRKILIHNLIGQEVQRIEPNQEIDKIGLNLDELNSNSYDITLFDQHGRSYSDIFVIE